MLCSVPFAKDTGIDLEDVQCTNSQYKLTMEGVTFDAFNNVLIVTKKKPALFCLLVKGVFLSVLEPVHKEGRLP